MKGEGKRVGMGMERVRNASEPVLCSNKMAFMFPKQTMAGGIGDVLAMGLKGNSG